jgi:hypothetical protein
MSTDDAPAVEYDFGIASVRVEGSSDDSLEDVREAAGEELESITDTVRVLKEMDMEIEEEARERIDAEQLANDSPTGSSFR